MFNKNVATFSLSIIVICSLVVIVAPAMGEQNNTYTAYGPIGTGPYIYMGKDPASGAVKLVRNENYWNKETLQNSGQFGVQELDLLNINGSSNALAALQVGNVDILNPYYYQYADVQKPWGDRVSAYDGAMLEIALNLQHPIFGTGVDTPLGKQNPSRAADAARFIRQAISHLISRKEIVDNIYNGYAKPGGTSAVTPITFGFDEELEPYSYDLPLAKQLLSQAGYDLTSSSKLFNLTLLVGSASDVTVAVASQVQINLEAAGIAVDRLVVPFNEIFNRVYPSSNELIGKIYAQGGFDAVFITYTLSKESTPSSLFGSFPPDGNNICLWNNTENERLRQLINNETNEAKQLEYMKQWQILFSEEQPAITISYPESTVPFNPSTLDKSSFEAYFPDIWPAAEKWVLTKLSPKTKIIMAVPQPLPVETYLSGTHYDNEVCTEVFETLTAQNDSVTGTVIPALATQWEASNNYKTWTVYLRQGVTWHDGVKFNASDVKFTFDNTDSDCTFEILDEYTVLFNLSEPDPSFGHGLYTMILPSHILKDIPFEDWQTHPIFTAANAYTINLSDGSIQIIPTPAVAQSFFEQYGIYIGVIIVAAVFGAITSVALVRRNKAKP